MPPPPPAQAQARARLVRPALVLRPEQQRVHLQVRRLHLPAQRAVRQDRLLWRPVRCQQAVQHRLQLLLGLPSLWAQVQVLDSVSLWLLRVCLWWLSSAWAIERSGLLGPYVVMIGLLHSAVPWRVP